MANNTATPNNYGKALSDNGGGVYITEWTSAFVRVWFFPRDKIPPSVTSGSPDISQFELPMANFQGSCDIDSHFRNHSIIINTDFCGAWAGFTYERFPECPRSAGTNGFDSCVDFVGNNPQAFVDAYWDINSIRVYQLPVAGSSSRLPTSTSRLSSSSPVSRSESIINPGMGQSTASLSLSVPYTGPLSSVTTTSTSSSATVLATPAICNSYNNTVWTNYNDKSYSISCGSDFVAESLNDEGESVNSFEVCLELCDGTDDCSGVSYLGGNGAGTCILKTGDGVLEYDGHTFAAVAVSGDYTASSTVVSASSTTPHKTATLRPGHQASTCPEANNAILMDENAVEYNVYCSADTSVGSFNSSSISSGGFTACFTICDVTAGCVGFTFVGDSSGTCFFKDKYSTTIAAPANYVVAFLADGQSSSPSSAAPSKSTEASSTVSSSVVVPSSASSSAPPGWSSLLSSKPYSSTSPSAPASSSNGISTSTEASSIPPVSMPSPISVEFPSTVSSMVSSEISSMISSMEYSGISSETPSSSTASPSPNVVYYVAPPCPSTVENICGSETPTTCSNARGSNFNVRCGSSYTGKTIDSEDGLSRLRIMKRVTEETYADCLDLCDFTDGCVGVNYKGDECTLFSEITGTVPDPDNVAATLLPPIPVTSTEPATSSPTATILPTSEVVSTPATATLISSSPSAPSSAPTMVSSPSTVPSSTPDPEFTCPDSAGTDYSYSSEEIYTIACGLNFQGGDLGQAFRIGSVRECLPTCSETDGCVGVVYNTVDSTCQLKYSFAGPQVPDDSVIVAGLLEATDPGISSTLSATATSLSSSVSSSVSSSSTGLSIPATSLTASGSSSSLSISVSPSSSSLPASSSGTSSMATSIFSSGSETVTVTTCKPFFTANKALANS